MRTRLGAAITAGGAVALGVGLLVPTGQAASAQGFTGQASAIFIQNLTLLGQPASGLDGGLGICDTGPIDQPSSSGQTAGTGLICNVSTNGALSPVADVSLLTNNVTTSGDTSNGSSTATSQLASVALLQGQGTGGADVLDATLLTANSGVSCSGGAAGANSASSSLATLVLDGTTLIGPGGSITDLGAPPNQTIDLAVAQIILNYQQFDPVTNTETVSPLVVSFPATGPLASVITGDVFVSYAQSDLGCAAGAGPSATPTPSGGATPTPSGTATPTPTDTGTPTPSASGSPSGRPSGSPHGHPTPHGSPTACPSSAGPGNSQEECHEADMAQCVEHESFPPERIVTDCPVHPPIQSAATRVEPPQRSDYMATGGAALMLLGIAWMRWEVRRRRRTG